MAKDPRKLTVELIKRNNLLSLSTTNGKEPWICTLYYFPDKDLNLYFLSGIHTRHSKELRGNSKVAVSIPDNESKSGDVKGLQISGTIEELSGKDSVLKLISYLKHFPAIKKYIKDPKMIIKKTQGRRMYKFVPEKFYYLDEENFENRKEFRL